MNITITGRHLNVSDNLKEYAGKKIKKLETYFLQLMDAHVIFYREKLDNGAEVVINGDGVQFHGREMAADLYSAIDLLFEKMEKQIARYKERHQQHKGPDKIGAVSLSYTGSRGEELRLNQVSSKPIDRIEAYLQMKIDNGNFILFKQDISEIDKETGFSNKNYAVIFKDKNSVKMAEIPYDKIKSQEFSPDSIHEYSLEVISDSPAKPDIKFTKSGATDVKPMTVDYAMSLMKDGQMDHLIFFNSDTHFFNVIYKNGKNLEVMVPAF
ncbi:MAG: ribosome-associated translation inhibitor RaiA [Spirochaetes bacterium]|jgi:putative sigma-54 modulation protein|nr:ribosome-associated translation inhibitor RaiA [Spirochaetota bacterium]